VVRDSLVWSMCTTAWFGRCALQLRRDVFLSCTAQKAAAHSLLSKLPQIPETASCDNTDCGNLRTAGGVLHQGTHWRRQKLRMGKQTAKSALIFVSYVTTLSATQITQQRIFSCRLHRTLSGGAEENNEKRHAKWSVPWFPNSTHTTATSSHYLGWCCTCKTRQHASSITFLTLNEKWQGIQHNTAGSWPTKWSKNGSHLNLLWQQKKICSLQKHETQTCICNTDLYCTVLCNVNLIAPFYKKGQDYNNMA
jgi:hypothetical protein